MSDNHLNNLKRTLVWKTLNEINQDYAQRALVFVQGVSPILETISKYFPYYTRHDASHSYNILNRYENILNPECFKKENIFTLHSIELYLLICAAYSHDLGMAVFPGEEDGLLKQLNISKEEGWEINEKLQEYLRANHSSRGYNYLLANTNELQVPLNLLSYLNEISSAHNLSTSELKLHLNNKYAAAGNAINLTQIAAILCVADALEFSDTRVNDSILFQLSEQLSDGASTDIIRSYQENMKHVCIGANLAVDANGEVVVNGTFQDSEVLNLAHKTFDDIERWLRGYLEIDSFLMRGRLRIRNHIIYRDLKYPHGDFERLGVRLKKENVINLISSNAVWNNKSEKVIKELLQNAVEACRYRKFNSSEADDYKPHIDIKLDHANREISISDNGCGMSRDTILDNFLTVGNSRSFSSDYSRHGYVSLARFGIGFWSVFTICDIAHIETLDFLASQGSGLKFDVSIAQFKDYILFEKTDRQPGTTITLALKTDIRLGDLYSRLYEEIICTDIPITIHNADSTYVVPKLPVIPSKEEIFGAKYNYAMQHNSDVFYLNHDSEEFNFRMFLIYRRQNDSVTFSLDQTRSVRNLISSVSTPKVNSLCGFTVNAGSVYTPFQIGSIGGYLANIRNPKGFKFNLNRTSFLNSHELENYLNILSDFLIGGYNSFLKSVNCTAIEDTYRLRKESTKGMRGGIGSSTVQILNCIKNFPNLMVLKLYKIRIKNNISTCDVEYYSIDKVLNRNYQIVSVAPYFSYINSFHIKDDIGILYDTLKALGHFEDYFLCESKSFFKILFDNDLTSYVMNIKFPWHGETIQFPIMVCNSQNAIIDYSANTVIGNLQGIGKWAGTIYFKNVVGANFVFVDTGIFIQPESELAKEARRLLDGGEYIKLTELFHLLAFAENGHIDNSIKRFL